MPDQTQPALAFLSNGTQVSRVNRIAGMQLTAPLEACLAVPGDGPGVLQVDTLQLGSSQVTTALVLALLQQLLSEAREVSILLLGSLHHSWYGLSAWAGLGGLSRVANVELPTLSSVVVQLDGTAASQMVDCCGGNSRPQSDVMTRKLLHNLG